MRTQERGWMEKGKGLKETQCIPVLTLLVDGKHLLDRHVEQFCDPERDLDGGVELPALYGVDRPAGDPEQLRKPLLRHVVHGPVGCRFK